MVMGALIRPVDVPAIISNEDYTETKNRNKFLLSASSMQLEVSQNQTYLLNNPTLI